MKLFKSGYGIIPACDIQELSILETLVKETCQHEFIQGYKIGVDLVIPHGIYKVVESIKKFTDLPIIYDHQKFGSDIPEVCSGKVLNILKGAGVASLIIFPQAGVETLKATVLRCQEIGLVPMVGGEMTHRGYLVRELGYIEDSGPERIYRDAAGLGVEYYIVPGTKTDRMKHYKAVLEKHIKGLKFLFPGIGKGQGGDIVEAFTAVKPCNSYAIVGRGIYLEKEPGEAAKRLWSAVEASTVMKSIPG